MTLPSSPLVGSDRFPVSVSEVDGPRSWQSCRMVLTCPEEGVAPRLMVFTAPGTPVLDVVWVPETSQIGRPRMDWYVRTDDGLWLVQHEGGCGCGHPLKRWVWATGPERRGRLPR